MLNERTVCYQGYSFVKDDKTGYYLSSRPINGKRVRLHRFVWENSNGEIPKGYAVHHIDRDKDNNDINNLKLMQLAEHIKYHAANMSESVRDALRRNMIENALPAAIEWHKTEAGSRWHSKHAKKVYERLKTIKTTGICENCGKEYEKYAMLGRRPHFCSNKCKSAWRRKQGLNLEERVCVYCGAKFLTDKYKNVSCCSRACAAKQRWVDRNGSG